MVSNGERFIFMRTRICLGNGNVKLPTKRDEEALRFRHRESLALPYQYLYRL